MHWIVVSGTPSSLRFVARPRRYACQPFHIKLCAFSVGRITRSAKLSRSSAPPMVLGKMKPDAWSSGRPLTRFGVRYLLRKYLPDYLSAARRKRIHPHSLRHTTAIHLLKAGVDFATISQWLGHAGLQTTMRYARADLDLKRQALAQVFPDALGAPKAGGFALRGTELTRWLRRL
jgi:Phage integrase family